MVRWFKKALLPMSAIALLCMFSFMGLMADTMNKKTILTTTSSLDVPGTTLPPGKYVVKLLDSPATRNIVQIFDENETKVLASFVAVSEQRPSPTGTTEFVFYEEGPNKPIAVRSWFYPGDLTGLQFVYPEDKAMTIAKTSKQPVLGTGQNADIKDKNVEIVMITPEGGRTAWSGTGTSASQTGDRYASSETSRRDRDSTLKDRGISDDIKKTDRDRASTSSQTQKLDEPLSPSTTTTSRDTVASSQPSTTMDRRMTTDSTADSQRASGPMADQQSQGSLPRTGSELPLLAVLGLFSLGAAGALRLISKPRR